MNVKKGVSRPCTLSQGLFSALARAAVSAVVALGLWTTPVPNHALAAEPFHRLNVVFVMADDLGWADLGCYGGKFYESPSIDRLAREGMRFIQAYTAGSVCSPTRSSIQTGKYPVRTGITDYVPGLHPAGVKLDTPHTRRELALEETTVAEALARQGYQTFYSGKWHLGGKGFEPQDQGYEVVVDDASLGNSGKDPLVGDRLTESALRFLDTRDKTRPFFMFLAYHEPHTPILAHPQYIDRFRVKAAGLPKPERESVAERQGRSRLVQDDAGYACEVAVLDDGVKRLGEKLEALGLTATTVFVFTSDNGGLCTKAQPGPTSNLPLRSGKGWLYEGGIRVPLIVRLPGVAKPGSTCDTPIISTDYFPTLLALTGAAPMPQQHLDGVSIVPLLRGGTIAPRALYWHYPHYHGSTWAPGSTIRDGDWKLIEFFEEDAVELYDLRDDVGERKDLAATMPDVARQLKAKLGAWREEVHAVIPKPAQPGKAEDIRRAKRKRARTGA
jgi:arylsulfatase A-like enzyme